MTGIKVDALVGDGASQNWKVFVLHKLANGINMCSDGVTYWIYNRLDPEKKKGVFLEWSTTLNQKSQKQVWKLKCSWNKTSYGMWT